MTVLGPRVPVVGPAQILQLGDPLHVACPLTHQLSAVDLNYSQCCQGCPHGGGPLTQKGPEPCDHPVPACTVHRQEEANTGGRGGAKAWEAEGLALHHAGQEGTAPCPGTDTLNPSILP